MTISCGWEKSQVWFGLYLQVRAVYTISLLKFATYRLSLKLSHFSG